MLIREAICTLAFHSLHILVRAHIVLFSLTSWGLSCTPSFECTCTDGGPTVGEI